MSYRDTTPIIENTTMQIYTNNEGVDRVYCIKPVDGYVLHDKGRDWEDLDENGNIITYQGFTRGTATCGIDYDFTTNPREFFTRLASEVPADQIFGGGNNNTETI